MKDYFTREQVSMSQFIHEMNFDLFVTLSYFRSVGLKRPKHDLSMISELMSDCYKTFVDFLAMGSFEYIDLVTGRRGFVVHSVFVLSRKSDLFRGLKRLLKARTVFYCDHISVDEYENVTLKCVGNRYWWNKRKKSLLDYVPINKHGYIDVKMGQGDAYRLSISPVLDDGSRKRISDYMCEKRHMGLDYLFYSDGMKGEKRCQIEMKPEGG